MNYILAEYRKKYFKPFYIASKNDNSKCGRNFVSPNSLTVKLTESDDFMSLYQRTFHRKKNTTFTFPSIQQAPQNMNEELDRNLLFTSPSYPPGLKANTIVSQSQQITKKTTSFFIKDKNIIDNLDNGDVMMRSLSREYFPIFTDKVPPSDELLKKMKEKVFNFENTSESLVKNFKTKQYSPVEIQLSLNSFSIKISNKETSKTFFLPLNVLYFYYSVSLETFYLFLTKIFEMSTELEDIKIIGSKISEVIKEIATDLDLFDETSLLKSSSSQKKKKLLWLIDNEELEIEITPPHLILKNKTVQIQKILTKGILLYLIGKNFSGWDSLSLCFLSSFKIFRQLVGVVYGKKITTYKQQAKYDMDEMLSVLNHQTEKKFSFFISLVTEDGLLNYYFTFNSYKILISLNLQTQTFEVPYSDTKLLYDLQKKIDLVDVVKKCVYYDQKKQKVKLNLDIAKSTIDDCDSFFTYRITKKREQGVEMAIKIVEPRIEWNDISTIPSTKVKDISSHAYTLNKEFLGQLLTKDLSEWPEIFNDHLDDMRKDMHRKFIRRTDAMKTTKESGKRIKQRLNRGKTMRAPVKKKFE